MKKIFFYVILLAIVIVTFNLISWLCIKVVNQKIESNREDDFVALPNFKNNPEQARINYREEHSLVLEYAPFIAYRYRPFKGKTIQMDTASHRLHTIVVNEPKNGKNIYFFGGSAMWGWGEIDNHTIPAFWNQRNPEWTSHNYSQTGYNSRQNLAELLNLLSEGKKIDVAVFYEGYNELTMNCSPNNELHTHLFHQRFKQKIENPNTNVFRLLFFQYILDFYRLVKSLVISPLEKGYGCECTHPSIEEMAKVTVNTWAIAKKLVEAQGGKFLLVLQPNIFFGNPKKDHLLAPFLKIIDSLKEEYQCLYTEILTYSKKKGYDWVYFPKNSLDGNDYLYLDTCHLSAEGNQRIAMVIDSLLKK